MRDGIRAHSWRIDPPPATPEARLVRFADRIAYLTHDTLDAIRADVLTAADVPATVRERLGEPGRGWIGVMVHAVVDATASGDDVAMEPTALEAMHELRAFLFEAVYTAGQVAARKAAAEQVVRQLVEYHLEHPEEVPDTYRDRDAPVLTQVVDYVAGMTDRYALAQHDRLFRPVLFREPSRTL